MKTRFQISTEALARDQLRNLARAGDFAEVVMQSPNKDRKGAGVAHLPEIVFLIEAENAALGDAGDLLPQILGVVILAKHRDVQAVLGEAIFLGHQLPGEIDGFALEVIAEGKIAEHFEERMMAASVADVIEIVMLATGAHAFLRRCGARVIAFFLAQENVLELVHSRVGEQQRRIVSGHQRRASDDAMTAGSKIVQEFLTNVGPCHECVLLFWQKKGIGPKTDPQ